jgi:ribonuclease HI
MDIVRALQTYDTPAAKLAVRWIQSEMDHSKERGLLAIADPLVQSLVQPMIRPTYSSGSILGYFAGTAPKRDEPPSPVLTTTTAPSTVVVVPTTTVEQVALFSDGACSSNGRKGAKAGFGVTVGLTGTGYKEMAQVAEPLLPSESQTNQRAELRGLSKAWSIATTQLPAVLQRMGKMVTTVHIYTDSQYSLDCILKWAPAWSKKGWTKADGWRSVLHRDVIEPLFIGVKTWKNTPYSIEFHHVRSHTGKTDPISIGNARADELATSTIS